MIIRKAARGVYDVFMGMGWPKADAVPQASDATWTRVRRFHWGIKPVAGAFLQRQQLQTVLAAIESNPQGSLENVNV